MAGTAAAALLLAGCVEAVRWTDRMNRPAAAARKPEPAPEGHYVVKPGDTLYSIAFRNQLDFRELAVWNDVGPDYLIRPGQIIRLSAPDIAPVGDAAASIQTRPLYPAAPSPSPAPSQVPSPPAPAVTPRPAVPAYEPPPASLAWQWPTQGPVVKAFANGAKGIDIGGAIGQPVLAAAAGKVVYSGSALKGYGELIIIKHDDLHLSAYGYNRRRLVGEDAIVAAGQPIAELGIGPEQKPVLHFEVRRKGKPVDPMGYLPSR